MQEEIKVIGRQINIAIAPNNDMNDIIDGGSPYLGYKFIVDANLRKHEVEETVKNMFFQLHKPYMFIEASLDVSTYPSSEVWSYEEIFDCIKIANLL